MKMLLIGGVGDGKFVDVPADRYWYAYTEAKNDRVLVYDKCSYEKSICEVSEYRQETFLAEGKRRSVLVVHNLTVYEAFEKLINNYKPGK